MAGDSYSRHIDFINMFFRTQTRVITICDYFVFRHGKLNNKGHAIESEYPTRSCLPPHPEEHLVFPRLCHSQGMLYDAGMRILTADEMGRADRVTSERFGISSLELMEHAGRAVARFVLRELPQCRSIVVLCGKGNNGGDGMVAARHLTDAGCAVSVFLLGDPSEVHGDAKAMLERLPMAPITVKEEVDL